MFKTLCFLKLLCEKFVKFLLCNFKDKNVTLESIVTAWILRHPAKMQMVVGSMNPKRLENIVKGVDVDLTKEEWYEIYRSAGNDLP